jgi:egghead protein (zeste-white 4 protein)
VRFPTVIFQITAIGKNARALDASARSVLHWIRQTPRLGIRHRLWLVIEPDGYASAPAIYESLRTAGAEVWIVPPTYATPLDTHGKARALQYAVERRQDLGISNATTWVYHQDEETCVGQDTLLGISDFILEARGLVGAGVILYPIDWAGSPSHVQELTRTYDDFRVLDSMTMPGNPTLGFHGSHILVRADVEDSVGWDARGYAPAEDLSFEIRVRAKYGSVFGVLKGFAYEKGAFSLRDQLRQRRRWVHGVMFAMTRSPELGARRRFTLLYSLFAWFSALPSVLILIASIDLHYGPMLVFTGIFTGFIWVSMVTGYLEGFRLHSEYVQRTVSLPRFVLHGMVGALVDVCAPWYALATRPSMGDFISKDSPARAPSALGGRPVD